MEGDGALEVSAAGVRSEEDRLTQKAVASPKRARGRLVAIVRHRAEGTGHALFVVSRVPEGRVLTHRLLDRVHAWAKVRRGTYESGAR